MNNLTSREAVILTIVQNKPCYGMQIRQEYENQTGTKMPLGSLYTTLNRMVDKNLVKSRQKGRFIFYDITSHGSKLLHSFFSSCGISPKAV